jgi:hypothetical protein
VLLEHDGAWASRFAAESERLRGAIVVVNRSSADACIAPPEAVGWEKGAHSVEKGPFIQAALRHLTGGAARAR